MSHLKIQAMGDGAENVKKSIAALSRNFEQKNIVLNELSKMLNLKNP